MKNCAKNLILLRSLDFVLRVCFCRVVMPKGMLLWKQHLAPPTPQLGIVMGTSRVGGQSPRVQRAVVVLLINEPFLISCCLVQYTV